MPSAIPEPDDSAPANACLLARPLDDVICMRIARRKQVHARALALRRGRAGVAIIIAATKPGAEQDCRLVLSGRVPLRYPYDDVMGRPDEVVAEIRQALTRTAARGASQ
jgi:hypothetical protein